MSKEKFEQLIRKLSDSNDKIIYEALQKLTKSEELQQYIDADSCKIFSQIVFCKKESSFPLCDLARHMKHQYDKKVKLKHSMPTNTEDVRCPRLRGIDSIVSQCDNFSSIPSDYISPAVKFNGKMNDSKVNNATKENLIGNYDRFFRVNGERHSPTPIATNYARKARVNRTVHNPELMHPNKTFHKVPSQTKNCNMKLNTSVKVGESLPSCSFTSSQRHPQSTRPDFYEFSNNDNSNDNKNLMIDTSDTSEETLPPEPSCVNDVILTEGMFKATKLRSDNISFQIYTKTMQCPGGELSNLHFSWGWVVEKYHPSEYSNTSKSSSREKVQPERAKRKIECNEDKSAKRPPSKEASFKGFLPKEAPSKSFLPKEASSKGFLPKEAPSKGFLPKEAPSKGFLPKEAPSKGLLPKEAPSKGFLPKEAPSKGFLPKEAPSKVLPKEASLKDASLRYKQVEVKHGRNNSAQPVVEYPKQSNNLGPSEEINRKVEHDGRNSGMTSHPNVEFFKSKKERTSVYSGRRTVHEPPSLVRICTDVIKKGINNGYVWRIPENYDFAILYPILDGCSATQLQNMERCNKHLLRNTGPIWEKHCRHRFKFQQPYENESWRSTYWIARNHLQEKLIKVTKTISNGKANAPAERQIKCLDAHVAPERRVKKLRVEPPKVEQNGRGASHQQHITKSSAPELPSTSPPPVHKPLKVMKPNKKAEAPLMSKSKKMLNAYRKNH